MLSKEEIEKAKERIQNSLNDICFATLYSQEENNEDERILLQYIDQLEQENNKQNKMIDEMAKVYMKVTSEKYRIKNICEKGKCQNEECHEDDWAECIKQYFEKKVE